MTGERRGFLNVSSTQGGADPQSPRGHDPAWLDLRSHTAYTATKPYKSQKDAKYQLHSNILDVDWWLGIRQLSEESVVTGDSAGCPGLAVAGAQIKERGSYDQTNYR